MKSCFFHFIRYTFAIDDQEQPNLYINRDGHDEKTEQDRLSAFAIHAQVDHATTVLKYASSLSSHSSNMSIDDL